MALDNEKLTERPALTNSQDTDLIHVVRGNFSYQKEAQNFNAGSISSLNDVGNVNVPAPQTDNYLYFDTNNNEWVAQPILLEDLLDVVIDENTLADGQVIAYDSNEEEWVNVDQQAGVTVGGADTQVQYNDSGSLGAGAFFTTDKSTKIEVTNEIGILGDGATEQGILKLYCENGNAHFVGIKGPNHAGGNSYELQLPNALPNVTNQILESNASGELSWINTPSSATFTGLTDTPASYDCQNGKNVKVGYGLPNPTELIFTPDYMDFACSDEDSDLAVARVFTMICNRDYPYVSSVEFSVTEAPTGANLEFDVLKNGTTVYTITPIIDAGEKLTATATTQQVINGTTFSLAIGDEFQVRITQVGSTDAGAGLKATMVYNNRICT